MGFIRRISKNWGDKLAETISPDPDKILSQEITYLMAAIKIARPQMGSVDKVDAAYGLQSILYHRAFSPQNRHQLSITIRQILFKGYASKEEMLRIYNTNGPSLLFDIWGVRYPCNACLLVGPLLDYSSILGRLNRTGPMVKIEPIINPEAV